MSESFLSGPSRAHRTTVIIIAALVLLAVIAVAAAIAFRTTDAGGHATPPVPKPDATVSVLTGPLTQLKGERTVEGVSVGYPHTTAGAVSAAAEYATHIGSTLDLDRARMLAGIVASPSYVDAEAKFVEGKVSSRTRLGLPASGPVPSGVSMTVGPAAFQLRAVSEDAMTVLLLSYLTTVDVNGTITPKVIVQPVDMQWVDGDWKLAAPGSNTDADFSSLLAQPGTSDASAKGWQVLTP